MFYYVQYNTVGQRERESSTTNHSVHFKLLLSHSATCHVKLQKVFLTSSATTKISLSNKNKSAQFLLVNPVQHSKSKLYKKIFCHESYPHLPLKFPQFQLSFEAMLYVNTLAACSSDCSLKILFLRDILLFLHDT